MWEKKNYIYWSESLHFGTLRSRVFHLGSSCQSLGWGFWPHTREDSSPRSWGRLPAPTTPQTHCHRCPPVSNNIHTLSISTMVNTYTLPLSTINHRVSQSCLFLSFAHWLVRLDIGTFITLLIQLFHMRDFISKIYCLHANQNFKINIHEVLLISAENTIMCR